MDTGTRRHVWDYRLLIMKLRDSEASRALYEAFHAVLFSIYLNILQGELKASSLLNQWNRLLSLPHSVFNCPAFGRGAYFGSF